MSNPIFSMMVASVTRETSTDQESVPSPSQDFAAAPPPEPNRLPGGGTWSLENGELRLSGTGADSFIEVQGLPGTPEKGDYTIAFSKLNKLTFGEEYVPEVLRLDSFTEDSTKVSDEGRTTTTTSTKKHSEKATVDLSEVDEVFTVKGVTSIRVNNVEIARLDNLELDDDRKNELIIEKDHYEGPTTLGIDASKIREVKIKTGPADDKVFLKDTEITLSLSYDAGEGKDTLTLRNSNAAPYYTGSYKPSSVEDHEIHNSSIALRGN